jgi:probable addiction module antidote protein
MTLPSSWRLLKRWLAYLEACIQEADGDAAFIAKALGDIARAKVMSQVARESGLSREVERICEGGCKC